MTEKSKTDVEHEVNLKAARELEAGGIPMSDPKWTEGMLRAVQEFHSITFPKVFEKRRRASQSFYGNLVTNESREEVDRITNMRLDFDRYLGQLLRKALHGGVDPDYCQACDVVRGGFGEPECNCDRPEGASSPEAGIESPKPRNSESPGVPHQETDPDSGLSEETKGLRQALVSKALVSMAKEPAFKKIVDGLRTVGVSEPSRLKLRQAARILLIGAERKSGNLTEDLSDISDYELARRGIERVVKERRILKAAAERGDRVKWVLTAELVRPRPRQSARGLCILCPMPDSSLGGPDWAVWILESFGEKRQCHSPQTRRWLSMPRLRITLSTPLHSSGSLVWRVSLCNVQSRCCSVSQWRSANAPPFRLRAVTFPAPSRSPNPSASPARMISKAVLGVFIFPPFPP